MRVFILTEGGSEIGYGHITRCLSLCYAFEEIGVSPEFIIDGDDSVRELLTNRRYKMLNWVEQKQDIFALVKNADVVIIDSYLVEYDFYSKVSELVKVPVYMDDTIRLDYPRGVVVNGMIYAEELEYPKKEGITYLLGVEYLPLKKELSDVQEREPRERLEKVLITFGGDDMRNMTPEVLHVLVQKFPKLIKNVIIGRGFKIGNIKDIENIKDSQTNLLYYPDGTGMKEIMLQSDIAISACGQTLFELARVGVPTIGIGVADNQQYNAIGWQKAGFILYAGLWNDKKTLSHLINFLNSVYDREIRIKLAQKGRKFVDGGGAKRVVKEIIAELDFKSCGNKGGRSK